MEVPKSKPSRSSSALKWSNFHVTISPNSEVAGNEQMTRYLREATEEMAQSDWLWRWLKVYKNGRRTDFEGAEKMDVETVRIRCALEEGGTQNQSVHAHLVIEIGHRTMVQVDMRGLQEVFGAYTRSNVNVKVQFIKGSGENLDYILKYLVKEVPRRFTASRGLREIQRAFGNADRVIAGDNLNPA